MAGVVAVFASRTEFAAKVDPISLFDSARRVRAAGLSLNLICQQVPDQYLRQWLTDGGELTCLFLDPDGEAIRARETGRRPPARDPVRADQAEHRHPRPRSATGSPTSIGQRLRLAVYDETIRFNLILSGDRTCVAQPYLPKARGRGLPDHADPGHQRPRWAVPGVRAGL